MGSALVPKCRRMIGSLRELQKRWGIGVRASASVGLQGETGARGRRAAGGVARAKPQQGKPQQCGGGRALSRERDVPVEPEFATVRRLDLLALGARRLLRVGGHEIARRKSCKEGESKGGQLNGAHTSRKDGGHRLRNEADISTYHGRPPARKRGFVEDQGLPPAG